MRQELDEALVRDFPLTFRDRGAPMHRTAMCWGFSCLDGWEPLIRRACEKLEPLIQKYINEYKDKPDFDEDWVPCASQVKEKYGTLRFYLSCGTDEMYEVVSQAEQESAETCEKCGAKGELRGHGWLYTSCKEHAKEGDNEPFSSSMDK